MRPRCGAPARAPMRHGAARRGDVINATYLEIKSYLVDTLYRGRVGSAIAVGKSRSSLASWLTVEEERVSVRSRAGISIRFARDFQFGARRWRSGRSAAVDALRLSSNLHFSSVAGTKKGDIYVSDDYREIHVTREIEMYDRFALSPLSGNGDVTGRRVTPIRPESCEILNF